MESMKLKSKEFMDTEWPRPSIHGKFQQGKCTTALQKPSSSSFVHYSICLVGGTISANWREQPTTTDNVNKLTLRGETMHWGEGESERDRKKDVSLFSHYLTGKQHWFLERQPHQARDWHKVEILTSYQKLYLRGRMWIFKVWLPWRYS